MIAHRLKRGRQAGENPRPVMRHPRGPAMHRLGRAHYRPALGMRQRLMPQTDPQNGALFLGKDARAYAQIVGIARIARSFY